MTSFGTEFDFASLTARRRRGFFSGSGSPILAATVISLASLENSFDRAASWRPLRCWMFAHLEWPAICHHLIMDLSQFYRPPLLLPASEENPAQSGKKIGIVTDATQAVSRLSGTPIFRKSVNRYPPGP